MKRNNERMYKWKEEEKKKEKKEKRREEKKRKKTKRTKKIGERSVKEEDQASKKQPNSNKFVDKRKKRKLRNVSQKAFKLFFFFFLFFFSPNENYKTYCVSTDMLKTLLWGSFLEGAVCSWLRHVGVELQNKSEMNRAWTGERKNENIDIFFLKGPIESRVWLDTRENPRISDNLPQKGNAFQRFARSI